MGVSIDHAPGDASARWFPKLSCWKLGPSEAENLIARGGREVFFPLVVNDPSRESTA